MQRSGGRNLHPVSLARGIFLFSCIISHYWYSHYMLKKNPYVNALLAALYITGIVSIMTNLEHTTKNTATILVPMMMLSLLVLSATVMAILFFYFPAKMFLDNQREAALVFFFKTLGTFACFAVILVLIFFFI